MSRVLIRPPSARDRDPFLGAARRSRAFHRGWGDPPKTPTAFRDYLRRARSTRHAGHVLVECATDELVGVVNVMEIVRGSFQSAYLGYYLFVPFGGRGYMTEGLRLVVRRAFGELRLHRLEANIQPANVRSIRLVERLGFRREGLSKAYLKIGGRWRDHERWALLREEWRPRG
jgi:[ribosomal protein S5]-alanine N-acetyltransferase